MDKTDDLEPKNDALGECEGDLDFILWAENLKKELPHFWSSLANRDKKLFVQCLLSLWLFTIITNVMANLKVL
jgi:hypothetical protein